MSTNSVPLYWDQSVSSDITANKIYYGTASLSYGTPISISPATSYTVTGLPSGHTYFFSVTAVNSDGESDYSNEISKTFTGTPVSSPDINGDGVVNMLDLQMLIDIILGIIIVSAGVGDLNGDGLVDVRDVQLLVNDIMGR